MKLIKIALGACLLAGLTAVSQTAPAADQAGSSDTSRSAPRPGQAQSSQAAIERRIANMTRTLGLSLRQQDEIRPLLQDEAARMQELRENTTWSGAEKREKILELRAASFQKVRLVLSAEQQKIQDDAIARAAERRKTKGTSK